MAEYVVSSTLARLDDLLIHEAKFLSGVEGQVKRLETELRRMQDFLSDAESRQDEDERLRVCLAQVRNVAYDAENVVETYGLKSTSKRTGGAINVLKRLAGIHTDHDVGSQIEEITARISDLTSEIVHFGVRASSQGEGSSSLHERQRRSYPRIVEDIVVGIEKNIEGLVTCLVEQNPLAVCIRGEDGLGKTTLAKKVYHHSKVRCHFDHFAWVYFDRLFGLRDVYERILLALTSPTGKQRDEIFKLKEGQLASNLRQLMGENKCLVVLDNISVSGIKTVENLEGLLEVLGGSKILLTSGDSSVALVLGEIGIGYYQPQLLNDEESWELLQRIARSGRDCADFNIDTRMEELGKNMVKFCLRGPLAITMLGGILATKYSSNEWQMVQDNIESYWRRREEMWRKEGYTHEPYSVPFLTLSYVDLPTWLKPCLLYLSQFPEDYEIDVNKLIRLWIAEGFVHPAPDTGDEEMLEDVAESYLNELIMRRMVIAGEREASLRIKTCRLHRLMRDLCFSKAKYESLHEIINYRLGHQYSSSSTSRRLAIHLHGHSCQFPLDNISPNLRSLLCFYDYDFSDERWRLRKPIFDKLKLLRILDLEGADIGEGNLLKDVGQLIYLRFLSLRHARVSTIPSSIGNLRCLQTLDLLIEGTVTDVPNVIWKMERLRHLYLPEFCDAKTKLRLETLKNLRTLVNFPAQNCDVRDLFSMTNLRELTIRDPISIKNFAKFSKSLSIKLKHLKALSLDNSYNEDDREAAKSKDLRSMSFGDLKVPSI